MHRDDSVAAKTELVEILGFKRFYEHFTFDFTFEETDWSIRGKRLEKYVRLLIAIELVTVGTKKEAGRGKIKGRTGAVSFGREAEMLSDA